MHQKLYHWLRPEFCEHLQFFLCLLLILQTGLGGRSIMNPVIEQILWNIGKSSFFLCNLHKHFPIQCVVITRLKNTLSQHRSVITDRWTADAISQGLYSQLHPPLICQKWHPKRQLHDLLNQKAHIPSYFLMLIDNPIIGHGNQGIRILLQILIHILQIILLIDIILMGNCHILCPGLIIGKIPVCLQAALAISHIIGQLILLRQIFNIGTWCGGTYNHSGSHRLVYHRSNTLLQIWGFSICTYRKCMTDHKFLTAFCIYFHKPYPEKYYVCMIWAITL